jgi:hypothetical protein
MRTTCLLFLFFLSGVLRAQAPTVVPLRKEPNHHLVIENSYVNVFRVSFPGHAVSLVHQHDVPYLYVSLGPADIVNAIQGRPELHQVLADGQVGYSPGHFAHLVRTDAGIPFNNVTIELMKPQGELHNLCDKVIDAPLNCGNANSTTLPSDSPLKAIAQAMSIQPLFETDELSATSFGLKLKQSYTGTDNPSDTPRSRLLVVQLGSEVRVEVADEPARILGGGEVLWLDAGKKWNIFTPGGANPTRFVLIAFK